MESGSIDLQMPLTMVEIFASQSPCLYLTCGESLTLAPAAFSKLKSMAPHGTWRWLGWSRVDERVVGDHGEIGQ